MATRSPVVIVNGQEQQLQAGDTLPVAALPVMVASGGSHAAGAVPDPGAGSGTTKFLREDASWQVPAGGGGGGTSPSYFTMLGAM